jgi:hypothetical protein
VGIAGTIGVHTAATILWVLGFVGAGLPSRAPSTALPLKRLASPCHAGPRPPTSSLFYCTCSPRLHPRAALRYPRPAPAPH